MAKSRERTFLSPPGTVDPAEDAAVEYRPSALEDEVARARMTHESRLMSIDGVEGVAVGQSPIGDPILVIYVRDASVRSKLPRDVGGYPFQVVVTGPIDAQSR